MNSIVSTQASTSPEKYEVTANIQNMSDSSEASSTIQIVYEVA